MPKCLNFSDCLPSCISNCFKRKKTEVELGQINCGLSDDSISERDISEVIESVIEIPSAGLSDNLH